MISISINQIERSLEETDNSWISQIIEKFRRNGQNPIIHIEIHLSNIYMALDTPGGPPKQYSSRKTTQQEQELFNFWDSCGLDKSDFSISRLLSFIDKLRGLS